jgi:RNA polymerase sigma-70 factor (ECF subfamily)
MGVVKGLEGFEGRSSFKTWLFRILANRARSAGSREVSHAPLTILPTVDPTRFDPQGQWADPLDRWIEDTEDRLDAAACRPVLRSAMEALPVRQRQVVLLRDVEGLSTDEACEILQISSGNQRILLHRGRAQLRKSLEAQMMTKKKD